VKIALVGMNLFNGNRGVGALGYSMLYLLEQLSGKYDARFEYYIVGCPQEIMGDNEIQINDLTIKFTGLRPCPSPGIKGLARKMVFYSHYKLFSRFDAVFDMNEGDSYSDIYGAGRFYYWNSALRYFTRMRIKTMLPPQTIGPFNDPKVKRAAIKTLEKCDAALARDEQSYDFLKQETRNKAIDEIIDVAFFMPFQRREFSREFIHAGLNVSALLWHGGYTKNNQFKLALDYQSTTRRIIAYFLSIPHVKLHLVPHVFDLNVTVENDYAVCFDLARELNDERIVLAPFFITPLLAKNYIAGLDFFMGARMHATIAAFSSGVPVYPLAYSRKFTGLYNDTLRYPYLADMRSQSDGTVVDGVKKAFAAREELKAMIMERMNTVVVQRRDKLERHIIDFLGLAS